MFNLDMLQARMYLRNNPNANILIYKQIIFRETKQLYG